jgi:hypothetical protein
LPTSATCFLTVFQEKIKKLCRNSRNYTKNLSDLGKKLKDLRKTQEYEALLGLLGLKKVHKKQAWFKAVLLGTTATNAGHWPPRVIRYRFRRRGVLHMRIKFRLFHLKKCKLNLSELKIYR